MQADSISRKSSFLTKFRESLPSQKRRFSSTTPSLDTFAPTSFPGPALRSLSPLGFELSAIDSDIDSEPGPSFEKVKSDEPMTILEPDRPSTEMEQPSLLRATQGAIARGESILTLTGEKAVSMRRSHDERVERQMLSLVEGVSNSRLNLPGFQSLYNFALATEKLRFQVRDGGYDVRSRQQIEDRLTRFDELSRSLLDSPMSKSDALADSRAGERFQSLVNEVSVGQDDLRKDFSAARGYGVLQRDGLIHHDERLDVRNYYKMELGPSFVTSAQKASQAASDPAPLMESFSKILSALDHDNDGLVNFEALKFAVRDPEIKGEDALALAAGFAGFHRISRGIEGLDSKTRLIHLDDFRPGSERSRYWSNFQIFGLWADELLNSSASLPPAFDAEPSKALWGREEEPDPLSIRQGVIGDCWFLATLSGMKPESLKEMISPLEGGGYDIHFPGLKGTPPVSVPEPTEAERYLNVKANGLWANILSRAGEMASLRGDFSRAGRFESANRLENGIDGGSSREGFWMLTGHLGRAVDVREMDTPSLGDLLEKSFAQERILTVATPSLHEELISTTRLSAQSHMYSVLGYDSEDRVVTVRNPWGGRESADIDGIDDGLFSMSLGEFQATFSRLGISAL